VFWPPSLRIHDGVLSIYVYIYPMIYIYIYIWFLSWDVCDWVLWHVVIKSVTLSAGFLVRWWLVGFCVFGNKGY